MPGCSSCPASPSPRSASRRASRTRSVSWSTSGISSKTRTCRSSWRSSCPRRAPAARTGWRPDEVAGKGITMTTTEVSAADQASVAQLTQQFLAAWAYGDPDGVADMFVEDGTLILPGIFRQGRDDIRAYFREAFDGPYRGTQVVGKPISLRFFGPDVALLLSSGGVLAAGETEVTSAQAIRASWLVGRT